MLGGTELRELCKLPLLVQHFKEHRQENPTMSLMAFLKLHYLEVQQKDADFQQDMELPFKAQHVDWCHIPLPLPNSTDHCIDMLNTNGIAQAYLSPLDDAIPECHPFFSVFQPPRMA
ncbi:MAG TPA: hypothetical protein DCQ29_09100 [Chitinophagaceae bacterium]|nr:hypothetical protein [Chitinophagaceae bacterium]